jgi:hypothetical protein
MAASGDGHARARGEFCYFVIHAVTRTLADLAGRGCAMTDPVTRALAYGPWPHGGHDLADSYTYLM